MLAGPGSVWPPDRVVPTWLKRLLEYPQYDFHVSGKEFLTHSKGVRHRTSGTVFPYCHNTNIQYRGWAVIHYGVAAKQSMVLATMCTSFKDLVNSRKKLFTRKRN